VDVRHRSSRAIAGEGRQRPSVTGGKQVVDEPLGGDQGDVAALRGCLDQVAAEAAAAEEL
jgi:hypothetical protein